MPMLSTEGLSTEGLSTEGLSTEDRMLDCLTVFAYSALRSIMDWLFKPLKYDVMRQALLAGVLIGILCP